MLLRTADPFREFDRLTQQLAGTTNRPAVMPMDAWREGDAFVLEFDLPGIAKESIDLDVERNVLTVRAERISRNGDWEMLATERPKGLFSRQLVLGDNLDLERIDAAYADGVLRLTIPVAEKAKPRKIEVRTNDQDTAVPEPRGYGERPSRTSDLKIDCERGRGCIHRRTPANSPSCYASAESSTLSAISAPPSITPPSSWPGPTS
jgi:HSP20 family protein